MQKSVLKTLIVTFLLGGCASMERPASIDWQHGAKLGTITKIFGASTPANELPACIAMFSGAQLEAHRFVEIKYPHRRHHFREVGELPLDVVAGAGDSVEFYPQNCDTGTLSKISRRLPLS